MKWIIYIIGHFGELASTTKPVDFGITVWAFRNHLHDKLVSPSNVWFYHWSFGVIGEFIVAIGLGGLRSQRWWISLLNGELKSPIYPWHQYKALINLLFLGGSVLGRVVGTPTITWNLYTFWNRGNRKETRGLCRAENLQSPSWKTYLDPERYWCAVVIF